MEQIKDIKGLFTSLVGDFDDYSQTLELFPFLGRKKFWHDTPVRSLGLING